MVRVSVNFIKAIKNVVWIIVDLDDVLKSYICWYQFKSDWLTLQSIIVEQF